MQLDDWVLCRIYEKSIALPPTTAAISEDQEEEEEVEEDIHDTILPSLRSPIGQHTLMPQKSSSFSNLCDAVDYSFLSSLLADSHCNATGFESSTFNYGSLDQPFINNSVAAGTSSDNYMFQKLPQLNSIAPNMENQLKRQHSNIDEDMLYPAKKLMNSCSFSNNNSQSDIPQCNLLKQSLFNQQLLLSPHLQFQK